MHNLDYMTDMTVQEDMLLTVDDIVVHDYASEYQYEQEVDDMFLERPNDYMSKQAFMDLFGDNYVLIDHNVIERRIEEFLDEMLTFGVVVSVTVNASDL